MVFQMPFRFGSVIPTQRSGGFSVNGIVTCLIQLFAPYFCAVTIQPVIPEHVPQITSTGSAPGTVITKPAAVGTYFLICFVPCTVEPFVKLIRVGNVFAGIGINILSSPGNWLQNNFQFLFLAVVNVESYYSFAGVQDFDCP